MLKVSVGAILTLVGSIVLACLHSLTLGASMLWVITAVSAYNLVILIAIFTSTSAKTVDRD